jgi:hypothetical protein
MPNPAFWKLTWWPIAGPCTRDPICLPSRATFVATGWTECVPLLHRGQALIIQALDRARQLLPFPLLGLDTDNGGEFINAEVLAYCEREHITFTRGRTHKSNDQCSIEQKNGAIVRQVVGYDRFSGEAALRQLAELYRAQQRVCQHLSTLHEAAEQTARGQPCPPQVRRSSDTARATMRSWGVGHGAGTRS